MIKINETRKNELDDKRTAEDKEVQFERAYPPRRQLNLIWEALEAIARGEALPQSVMTVLQIRNNIRNQ